MILRNSALSQSVSLYSITTDKFKTGNIYFSVMLPYDKTTSPYDALLADVLRRSTSKYPTRASFAKRLDELYSASVGFRSVPHGKNSLFSVFAEILDDRYVSDGLDVTDCICETLSDMLFSPLLAPDGDFTEEALTQEKRRNLKILTSIKNNPRKYASNRLTDIMRRDDPEHLNTDQLIEIISAADRHSLSEFYRQNIVTRQINVFYIGTLTHEQIAQKVMRHLGSHKATLNSAFTPLVPPYPERDMISVDEDMPINQGRLEIGLRSDVIHGDPDAYALDLACAILGGSPSSKLFMNVREKMSLCYSCASYYSPITGTVSISSGINPKNREIAQNAILKEFHALQAGEISERELNCAKKDIENSYREVYDDPLGLISYYLKRVPFGITRTLEEERNCFSALTLDDVVRAANRIKLDSIYFLNGTECEGEEEEDD